LDHADLVLRDVTIRGREGGRIRTDDVAHLMDVKDGITSLVTGHVLLKSVVVFVVGYTEEGEALARVVGLANYIIEKVS
jgi:hypothetical protein